jgi:hypothetical protein
MLALVAKILAIGTVVTAVVTQNYALVFVAAVMGAAIVLFQYLKRVPRPVSLLDQTEKNAAAACPGAADYYLPETKLAAAPTPTDLQTPPAAIIAAMPGPQYTVRTVRSVKSERPPARPAAAVQPPHWATVPNLADTVPPATLETRESRMGRSRLLRQEINAPAPLVGAVGLRAEIRRLNPLPAGPHMELVTPEELAAMNSLQPAPFFQRV